LPAPDGGSEGEKGRETSASETASAQAEQRAGEAQTEAAKKELPQGERVKDAPSQPLRRVPTREVQPPAAEPQAAVQPGPTIVPDALPGAESSEVERIDSQTLESPAATARKEPEPAGEPDERSRGSVPEGADALGGGGKEERAREDGSVQMLGWDDEDDPPLSLPRRPTIISREPDRAVELSAGSSAAPPAPVARDGSSASERASASAGVGTSLLLHRAGADAEPEDNVMAVGDAELTSPSFKESSRLHQAQVSSGVRAEFGELWAAADAASGGRAPSALEGFAAAELEGHVATMSGWASKVVTQPEPPAARLPIERVDSFDGADPVLPLSPALSLQHAEDTEYAPPFGREHDLLHDSPRTPSGPPHARENALRVVGSREGADTPESRSGAAPSPFFESVLDEDDLMLISDIENEILSF
jgi:hypothetical protein